MGRGDKLKSRLTDEQFIAVWEKYQSPLKVSQHTGMSIRATQDKRRRVETRHGITLFSSRTSTPVELANHPGIIHLSIDDGVVLVASDAHYWPGIITTAHTVFVQFCKELKPRAVIMNGDVIDGAAVSRYPPIGWEHRPTLVDEVNVCKERLGEIEDAAPNARKIWTLGNHDARFETRLASKVPEFARIKGVHLKDHFPHWSPAWSCWINENTVIKHRFNGGIHATHNNTVAAGKTMVTGHLHSLKVTPYSDYNGVRWGVDTGTIAPLYGPQTSDYCETSPVNWRQGFIVLTYHKGRLLWPEIVHVTGEDEFEFRGKFYKVEPA
jgi:hypothetical protein